MHRLTAISWFNIHLIQHQKYPWSLTVSTLFKSIKSLLTLKVIVVPSKPLKNASHIPWHILYILPLRKEKWGILSKYWTKARLKPNPANIKAWSSMSRIWGFLLKGFGWLPPCRFTTYVIHFSLGLVPPCVQLSLANVSWFWCLQHWKSSGQHRLYSVSDQGLCTGTPPLSWLPDLINHFFVSTQEDPTSLSILYYLCLQNCYYLDDNAKFSWQLQLHIDVVVLGISFFLCVCCCFLRARNSLSSLALHIKALAECGLPLRGTLRPTGEEEALLLCH